MRVALDRLKQFVHCERSLGTSDERPVRLADAIEATEWRETVAHGLSRRFGVSGGTSPGGAAEQSCGQHLHTTTRNFLPLPPRNERGEGRGEGHSIQLASSPRPSPPLREEREKTSSVRVVAASRCAQSRLFGTVFLSPLQGFCYSAPASHGLLRGL